MTIINIDKIVALNSSDNQPMTYIKGHVIQSNFNLGVQPASVAYLEVGTLLDKVNDSMDLKLHFNPTYMLEIENKDPWELFGSDHNSGILWFGKSTDMDAIHQQIEKVYLKHPKTLPFAQLTDESMHISGSPIVRWNYDDGTSLIISYVDTDYHNIRALDDIQEKDVISYQFGASIDDRLAHEFLQPYIARLLKKIKTPLMEIDIEDLGDEDDYPIEVNGKSLTSKHNDLLLKLAEHLYCSILKLHETGSNDLNEDIDEYAQAFAQKLEKNTIINNLEKPTADISTRLTYIYNGSNKEYTISFKKNDANWEVDIAYGSIGKKLTEDKKISTSNIEEGQAVYLELLKDKLARGYDMEQPNPKLKLHP